MLAYLSFFAGTVRHQLVTNLLWCNFAAEFTFTFNRDLFFYLVSYLPLTELNGRKRVDIGSILVVLGEFQCNWN